MDESPAPPPSPADPVGEDVEVRVASDVRERIARLEVQLQAVFTSMAAYATIAKQDVDAARAEVHHDAERRQSTLIGLMERLREEMRLAISRAAAVSVTADGDTVAAPQVSDLDARLVALEQRIDAMTTALESSGEAQRTIAEQVTILVEDKLRRDGWIVTDGAPDRLSLR